MKVIYKKDSKGKIRFLGVSAEGDELVQTSGVVGSDNPVEHRKVCKGKNIGKSNETTPAEQAVLMAASKIASKMSEGYFDSVEKAQKELVILPMLAKSAEKEMKKVIFPCYVQPKLDGMRALYNTGEMISRKGKAIETMGHITEDIQQSTHMILDGELYAHGKSFQDNMRLIKKYRPDETEAVKYHVYDIVSDLPFGARYEMLKEIAGLYAHVEVVETRQIFNEDELKEAHSEYLAAGYEGTMIRWGDEGYKINGRSSNLLKYKDFIDISARIIDIEPAESRPEWGTPVLDYGGVIFRAGTKLSHTEREELLTNKSDYIGQMAEIRFFEFSESGTPRFPVYYGIRLDK